MYDGEIVMIINKAYKYRIYPNKEQQVLLEKHFGCVRWIYNYALEKKIQIYKETKKSISRFELQKDLLTHPVIGPLIDVKDE